MIEKTFDEVVLYARTGLNPRTNFKLGQGQNKYITIKNIRNNSIVIDNQTDIIDDEAIKLIHKRSQIKKGDVLFCSIGRMGDMYIIPEDPVGWDINESVFAFTLNTEVIRQKYFYYTFKHQGTLDFLAQNSSGSTFKSIKMNQLRRMVFNLPSLQEQDHIISMLDGICSIIEARYLQLQRLDDLVKARFVEMFVATDAASDWPYCTIADVSNDMRTGPFGSALHHDEFVDSGVFVLGIDNAVENKFSYNRMRYITAEKYQELKRYTVYPGDVIITIMGTVGRSAVIPANMPKAINTKHLACITPNAKMVNAQFLSCAFQVHPDIRAQLQKQCKGAIMDGLNLTIIKGLSFHIPPINLQDRFVGFYEQVDKSKSVIQKALDEAQLLFDSVMQKYFG